MDSRLAREVVLPFAHAKVKLEDLKPNGKLFADDEIEPLIAAFNAKRDYYQKNPKWGEQGVIKNNVKNKQYGCRLKKSELNSRFGVIQFEDNYFAIYRGVKQNHHLGGGGYGYTKLVQNIRTGEWAVIKLCKMAYDRSTEFKILKKVGMGYGQLERIAGDGSYFLRIQGSVKTLNQNNIVMKLAPGMTLVDYRDQGRANTDVARLQVCIRVLEALQRLHEKGIIHGDISLKNVFYDNVQDLATFIDYGVAKKKPKFGNPSGELVVTEGYYAPELNPQHYSKQKKHYTYSYATDTFAVGALISYFLSEGDLVDYARLQDRPLRTAVAVFCGMRLCAEKPGARPTIQQAITFFQEKRKGLLNVSSESIKKIALIALPEYRQLRDAAHVSIESPVMAEPAQVKPGLFSLFSGLFQRPAEVVTDTAFADEVQSPTQLFHNYCKQLQSFEQVWFMDTNQQADLDYIAVRRDLENFPVTVGNRCFIAESSQIRDTLQQTLRQIYHTNDGELNKLYFVTADKCSPLLAIEFKDSLCIVPVASDVSAVDIERLNFNV